MFLSKTCSNLLQNIPKSSLFSLASRSFSSSDVGKINEKYNKKMVERLIKSHESLTLPNLTLENVPQEQKSEFIPFQSYAAGLYNRVKDNKYVPDIPALQTANDYSLEINQVNDTMLSIMQNKSLKGLYQYVDYDNKLVYPKIIFAFRDFVYKTHQLPNINKQEINEKLIKLAACFESLSLGFYLHDQLESLDKMRDRLKTTLYGLPTTLGIVDKYLRDDRVLLAGDFFHTKTARMSAEFGIVEIPYYVAVVIEAVSKAVIKKNEIKAGKAKQDIKNEMYIAYHETSIVLAMALKSAYVLMNENMNKAQNEAITEFALSFGAGWHIGSEYKKEIGYDESLGLKNDYSIKNFLNKETQRLNYQDDVLTLINLVHAHILESEKSLVGLTGNEQETKNFVEGLLLPVIVNPYPARETKTESIFDKIKQN